MLTTADDPEHVYACFYPVGSPEYEEREDEIQAKLAAERLELTRMAVSPARTGGGD